MKWRMEGVHQSGVNESVKRTGYYLRNKKRKIKMVRTCGKNIRRKSCEECIYEYSRRKTSAGKPRRKWFDDVENDVKKIVVTCCRKNS